MSGGPAGATYGYAGDEHGRLFFPPGSGPVPALGARIELATPHCDPTVNLHDFYHLVRGDTLVDIWPVDARGKRPSALKAELEGRLKDFIVSPSVVVNVDEAQPFMVVCLGEVGHPGAFLREQDPRLAHALAMAGGLSDFASRSSIYVVRSEPHPVRIRFTYDSVRRNAGGAADFELHRGDLVEVE